MLNEERHLNEFLKLVRISSESGTESEIANYIYTVFSSLGLTPEWDSSHSRTGSDSDNLFIKIPGTKKGPVIMFNAHMDTVIPGRNIQPDNDGEYIKTDGTTILGSDDKAGIAAIIETIRVLKEQGTPHHDLIISLTTSEEIGLIGAKHIDFMNNRPDYCYVLDSGGDVGTIVNQAPYQETFTVKIHGVAAHAGIEPEKGKSAIQAAAHVLSAMQLGRLDAETTANVGLIRGGAATNIVPEYAEFTGEVRSISQYKLDTEIARIKKTIDDHGKLLDVDFVMTSKREYNGYKFNTEDPSMQYLIGAINRAGFEPRVVASGGGSDANVFNSLGIPSVVLGIGMELVHTRSERISIKNLNNLVKLLLSLAVGPR